MHVIAHYRIADPAAFRARLEGPIPRPHDWRLIASVPTRDGAACYELWWVESARALERLLAAAIRPAGTVECREVDDDQALGLAGDVVLVVGVRSRGGSANNGMRDPGDPDDPAPCHGAPGRTLRPSTP